ncbi:HNH endonuclease signature motif containing protein [Corynebacterium cystitidis]|uniref:HNH endonuclease signature motif containing protein n=1 Tax=Corynebacterium cystitidis TaxID=35757 RepID=UPI00211F1FF4|nr:HNH endonuclease signature motif containing protein [Corynebacterium cystitidis]
MNINDMLRQESTAAMTLLADLQPPADLIAAGVEPDAVDNAHALYEIYYGTTTSTRKQREARSHATDNQLGFHRLYAIEKAVSKLYDDTKAWALRHDLTRFSGRKNKYDFADYAKKKLAHYNRDAPAPQPKKNFRVTNHSTGESSMSIRGNSATIREFEHAVRERAHADGITTADAATRTLHDLINTTPGSTTSAAEPTYVMKLLVWLDDLTPLLDGDTSDPTVVSTTGATMPLTQALSKKIHPRLEIIGLSPAHGAIGLAYANNPLESWENTINTRAELEAEQARRAQAGEPPFPQAAVDKALSRHGTTKDRALLEANQTVCAGLGCSVPAAYCEINHNIPHSKGGLSVLTNMCLLCKYHNGKAGAEEHYTNAGGIPHRILPSGRLKANNHRLATLSPVRRKHTESDSLDQTPTPT